MPIFPTLSDTPRPIRLAEATRQFAYESQMGKYGDDAMSTPYVDMTEFPGFFAMEPMDQYDVMLSEIVRKAPVRVTPYERIAGAATLGAAILHVTPAYANGKFIVPSISHVTLGFDRAVREGMDSYEERIKARLQEPCDTYGRRFLISLLHTIDSMRVWHARYMEALRERPEIRDILRNIPFRPASSFKEALQSLWFLFAFTRLAGNWSGIGRIDALLGPYLKADLEKGDITLDEAREYLASFFIKGCEWIRSSPERGTGDSQHYQNIVLAGVDEKGNSVINEVTYLVLEVIEELNISDFPIAVRVNQSTPDELLEAMARVIRHGGGIVAEYNEDLILNALGDLGYPPEEARLFANDGCWEVQVPGKTNFGYIPFDALRLFQRDVLKMESSEENPALPEDFESLYRAAVDAVRAEVDRIYEGSRDGLFEIADGTFRFRKGHCCPVVSLFEEGCIESARSYCDGGARYTVRSPHIGGAPDVVNSLLAIKKLVFDEQRLTLTDFRSILLRDWEGEDVLRQYVLNKYAYFGNDSPEVDGLMARFLNDFSDMVLSKNSELPWKFIPGVSTFGRQIDWLPTRASSPHGHKRGDILAGNLSPTPGTDKSGATAIIKSYCASNMRKLPCGAALDIRLMPSAVKGGDGIASIAGLLRGFAVLGGFFMQIDVVDNAVLLEAQKHPENYKSLAVRVSGWSARFVTLNEEWQNMIIERTASEI